MNIAIDVRPVERPASRHRGVGLYTRHLCRVLLERNRELEGPHAFTVMTSDAAEAWNGAASVRRVPAVRKPSRLQWVLDRSVLPRALGVVVLIALMIHHPHETE